MACVRVGCVCYTVCPAPTDWQARLSEQERGRRAREFSEWCEPHVLVQSGADDAVFGVSTLRLRRDATVRGINGRPVLPIGVLPLDRNSSLHVIVETDACERAKRRET